MPQGDDKTVTLSPEFLSYHALTLVGSLPGEGPECRNTGSPTATGSSSAAVISTDAPDAGPRLSVSWNVVAVVVAVGMAI